LKKSFSSDAKKTFSSIINDKGGNKMKRGTKIFFIIICLLTAFGGVLSAGDKPTFDLKWYGYFKFDGAYDQNLTSHGNYVMWVQQRAYNEDDGQLNMTANETRFGVNVNGNGYNNVKVGGKMEFDLYASVTGSTIAENKAMLQLRHAYLTIESGKFKMLAGQSWDLISPLNPSTLNYTVLWGVGNIGYRRPQVSFWYNFKSGAKTDISLATGIFRNIGTDLTPTFSLALGESTEGADDGTDAGIPTVQGLLDCKHNLASGGSIRAGISGLWGELKAETNQGRSDKYYAKAISAHLMVAPKTTYGFSGEFYSGTNLGSYFGGILLSSTVDGVKSAGGWVSSWVQPTNKVQLSAGYGVDNPDDDDFSTGRCRNSCVYGNVRYTLVSQVTVGFELSEWRTGYKNAETVKDLRAQSSIILNF
jgi:hypothetical protein